MPLICMREFTPCVLLFLIEMPSALILKVLYKFSVIIVIIPILLLLLLLIIILSVVAVVCVSSSSSSYCDTSGDPGVCVWAGDPGVCMWADDPCVCVWAGDPGVCMWADDPCVCVWAGDPGVCCSCVFFLSLIFLSLSLARYVFPAVFCSRDARCTLPPNACTTLIDVSAGITRLLLHKNCCSTIELTLAP